MAQMYSICHAFSATDEASHAVCKLLQNFSYQYSTDIQEFSSGPQAHLFHTQVYHLSLHLVPLNTGPNYLPEIVQ
jgi:hypothetical protein